MTDSQQPLTAEKHKEKPFAYRIAGFIVKPLMTLLTKKRWSGVENIPSQGGFLAVGNHASNLDALTFAHYLYNSGRPGRILAKHSLWKIPVLKWLLEGTQMIPVKRGSTQARESIVIAQQRLEQGYCVAVFPEGTHTRDPNGWPMQAHTGVARMALNSKVPVIPIAQWGATQIWPRGTVLPKPLPRKVTQVRAGAPVDLSDLYDQPLDSKILREATDRIMWAIMHMLEEMRGETAPPEFYGAKK